MCLFWPSANTGSQVSHLIHDCLLCPKGTSCCPWLNTEFPSLSHTPSHTGRRINAHTQTSQTCKYYLGIFCSCHLGFGLHNHIHRHAQKQHMSGKGFGHILGIILKKLKNNLCTLPNQFKHVRTLWVWSTTSRTDAKHMHMHKYINGFY